MMLDPSSTTTAAAAQVALVAAAVPVLEAFGVPLGLRIDVLLAGLFGALAAIALLNTVPSTGDTWRELIRTTLKRTFVVMASSVTAGYLVPGVAPIGTTLPSLLFCAFLVGAGAQKFLALAIERYSNKEGTKQ
jgi:hypothetical protein